MDNNREQGQLEQQRQKRLAKLKYEAAQEYGLPAGQSLEPETEDDSGRAGQQWGTGNAAPESPSP
ncbi:MAG: hypothetical protein Q4B48_03355 [Syntrophomonadaceae bacterium]|nr:hypothetical protein [Syntrophomonadaceae bacterium]